MKLVLTEEIQERELCAQGEVLVRCRCMLPKLQPLPPRAQRRLERYLTELDRRWNRACEGWLLEQAAAGAVGTAQCAAFCAAGGGVGL